MSKKDFPEDQQAIEPMKLNIKKDSLKLAESALAWHRIYTYITILIVLLASAYILYLIIN